MPPLRATVTSEGTQNFCIMIWCIIWKDNLVASIARVLILTNSDWDSRMRNTPLHLRTWEPSQWMKTSQTMTNCVEQPVAGHCGCTLTSSQQSGEQKNVKLCDVCLISVLFFFCWKLKASHGEEQRIYQNNSVTKWLRLSLKFIYIITSTACVYKPFVYTSVRSTILLWNVFKEIITSHNEKYVRGLNNDCNLKLRTSRRRKYISSSYNLKELQPVKCRQRK